ncbi:hypothetical protein Celaphus_00009802, partial [Cervus elaphus hippelaphus]
LRQRIEVCLQTVAECNPWFPNEAGTNSKVSPLIEPNDSGNDFLKVPFTTKTDNNFLSNNTLPPS